MKGVENVKPKQRLALYIRFYLSLFAYPIILLNVAYLTYSSPHPMIYGIASITLLISPRSLMTGPIAKYIGENWGSNVHLTLLIFMINMLLVTLYFIGGITTHTWTQTFPSWFIASQYIIILGYDIRTQIYNCIVFFFVAVITLFTLGADSRTMESVSFTLFSFGVLIVAMIYFIARVTIAEKERASSKALAESAAFYRTLYSNAPIMLFTISKETFRILDLNKRASLSTGLCAETCTNVLFTDLFDEDCREQLSNLLLHPKIELSDDEFQNSDFFADGGRYLHLIGKDGTVRYVSMNMSIAQDALDIVLHDMTKVYEAHREVQILNSNLQIEKERAEQASTARSQFVAKVSHELRTPLHGVISACDLLNDTNLNEKQSSYVNIIDKSGKLLLSLINTILDFSKIDSGKISINLRPFMLFDCIDNVISMMRIKAKSETKERGDGTGLIDIILDIAEDVPNWIISDELCITQVRRTKCMIAVKKMAGTHQLDGKCHQILS